MLFSIGNVNVSSTGVFLALGFIWALFLIWRLARAWDLDEEHILDITLLTFIGGLIGARVYFVLQQLPVFIPSPLNIVMVHKVAGFNFWGGFLGGWLSLYFFARRKQMDFWQLADIMCVGLLGGLVMSQIGCLLGSCNIGTASGSFLAVSQEGFIGRRLPVQLFSALLFMLSLKLVWNCATHFHPRGKIVSSAFIHVGLISLVLEPIKQDHADIAFYIAVFILGLVIYYKITRQHPLMQLQKLAKLTVTLLADAKERKQIMQNVSQTWYNVNVSLKWKLKALKKH